MKLCCITVVNLKIHSKKRVVGRVSRLETESLFVFPRSHHENTTRKCFMCYEP